MNKLILQITLLITTSLTIQSSFAQNLLLLQDKVGKKDCIVRTGKKVKIETNGKQIIKGKIILIKDSSIVLNNKSETEIAFADIHYFYHKSNSGWKTAGGIFLAFSAMEMTVLVAAGLSQNSHSNQNSNNTKDNPIPGLAVVGAIALPALYTGAYYGLIHKKKYDTQVRYNLIAVKNR